MPEKIVIHDRVKPIETYKTYTCEFDDSQDEDGDHVFCNITFPGDVDVPAVILVKMVKDADKCGIVHEWEVLATEQYEDEGKHSEYRGDGVVNCTVYTLHRET
ncbi:MAG: hypothetical protein RBG13Loki_4254 [Promethearchaeota archaeon CR_4]|nr:MAG: hypothetical protein RBG13Loki_4254 [Candidatus Lokiarchaeota archaeon CR_4]